MNSLWLIMSMIVMALLLLGIVAVAMNRYLHLCQKQLQEMQNQLNTQQLQAMGTNQTALRETMQDIREQLTITLGQQTQTLSRQLQHLSETTAEKLQQISGQVDKRLSEGFEKTTATFTDVVKRLALIDAAQKKISELTSSVVSLQEILGDKRSRGAFGEVQLSALVHDLLPENTFTMQATLSNQKRVDCLIQLPEPTGNICIDAKFPLENYRAMHSTTLSEEQRKNHQSLFRQDIRRHVQDIAEKYILPGETADGAILFLPAESIFSEIHTHYPELIDFAQKSRVWLVSPTTMMAVLNTARAVLKDQATQKQVHLIQQHLQALGKDFQRFEKRMNNLAKHIDQAHSDVQEVKTSAKKITARFSRIEQVELNDSSDLLLEEE